MEIRPLRLAEIDESPTNPRKHFDPVKLAELARSIVALGVKQPIEVRPRGSRFELVFGARRVRAAKLAGLKEVPGIISDLSDDQVLEAQLTENAAREDVHPLDEADAYKALHEKHGRAIEEIATRVGKSTSHIYGRLKLCDLRAAGRKAFYEGKIEASVALILARIPSGELQDKATAEVLRSDMRRGEVAEYVRDRYMLVLASAPFGIADETLVPAAGACSGCPKRTGNQKELFPDVDRADLCTDPVCYRTKTDAAWLRMETEAKKSGARVLTDKEAKKVFPYGDHVATGCGYTELDAKNYGDKKQRTFRACLGKGAKDLLVVLARDANGAPRHLVETKDLGKALRAAGAALPWEMQEKARGSSSGGSGVVDLDERRKQANDKAKQAREFRVAVIGAVVEKAAADGSSPGFWRTMARCALDIVHAETRKAIAARRGLTKDKRGDKALLEAELDKMDQRELALFALEAVVSQGAIYSERDKLPVAIERAAKDLGVDLKAVRGGLIKAAAEKRKAR